MSVVVVDWIGTKKYTRHVMCLVYPSLVSSLISSLSKKACLSYFFLKEKKIPPFFTTSHCNHYYLSFFQDRSCEEMFFMCLNFISRVCFTLTALVLMLTSYRKKIRCQIVRSAFFHLHPHPPSPLVLLLQRFTIY